MGKGKRLKAMKKEKSAFLVHAQDVLTRKFQEQIRQSEMWPQMVAEFGEQKAAELLAQCKGELRPGLACDEVRDYPEDL